MKILLWSNHRYGSYSGNGVGRHPREFTSGSGHYIHDALAKGLAELGHEVLYYLESDIDEALPDGVERLTVLPEAVDILHNFSSIVGHAGLTDYVHRCEIPWVATCHLDIQDRGLNRGHARANWIFVSRTLAQLYGRDRYVHNGIDPSLYIYAETKQDYFLFVSSMDWAFEKGLDTAFALAADIGFRLVVAGTSGKYPVIHKIEELCGQVGAEYVGDVRGERKAELFAGARALLYPTRVNEAFGLAMAEALMSGTPVICSDAGACPEIISPDVGFVCRELEDYDNAIERVALISSSACRKKAMNNYHYQIMAKAFAKEYEKEILQPTRESLPADLSTFFSVNSGRGL